MRRRRRVDDDGGLSHHRAVANCQHGSRSVGHSRRQQIQGLFDVVHGDVRRHAHDELMQREASGPSSALQHVCATGGR